MLEEILRTGFRDLGITPDPRALERYRTYYEFLQEKNQVMNLTAISGEEDTARLHFLDSAALLSLTDFRDRQVIDVGTGAGFPGLALKIACPSLSLTLLDSLDKRIRFLEELCALLELEDVHCLHARAEEAPPDFRQRFDIATARAVSRLDLLAELCLPLVKPGGLFLAMKGPEAQAEVDAAAHGIALLGGKTERVALCRLPGAEIVHSVVMIRKVADTPRQYPRRWAQIKKQPL